MKTAMMERSNIFLDTEDKNRIKEIADIQGINYSEAVRNAMKMYIQCHEYFYEKNIKKEQQPS